MLYYKIQLFSVDIFRSYVDEILIHFGNFVIRLQIFLPKLIIS